MKMNDWRPMSEHAFPWDHDHLIVIAFDFDMPDVTEIFRCSVGEHGALFPDNTMFLTLLEQRWIPYAWRIDDTPDRDDAKLPPMWADYLVDYKKEYHKEED